MLVNGNFISYFFSLFSSFAFYEQTNNYRIEQNPFYTVDTYEYSTGHPKQKQIAMATTVSKHITQFSSIINHFSMKINLTKKKGKKKLMEKQI